jgi:hypothetical protein
MSRSTPLNNLPNKSTESSQAYDEKENALVKEILQEIDTEKNPNNQAMLEQQQAIQQQAMYEQAMEKQAIQQHERAMDQQKHMDEQTDMQTQMLENQNKEPVLQSQSMVEKVISMAKIPLIVAVIAVLVSVPAFTTMLEGVIKSKASLAAYATIIILLVKGIIAGGLYFGINKSL